MREWRARPRRQRPSPSPPATDRRRQCWSAGAVEAGKGVGAAQSTGWIGPYLRPSSRVLLRGVGEEGGHHGPVRAEILFARHIALRVRAKEAQNLRPSGRPQRHSTRSRASPDGERSNHGSRCRMRARAGRRKARYAPGEERRPQRGARAAYGAAPASRVPPWWDHGHPGARKRGISALSRADAARHALLGADLIAPVLVAVGREYLGHLRVRNQVLRLQARTGEPGSRWAALRAASARAPNRLALRGPTPRYGRTSSAKPPPRRFPFTGDAPPRPLLIVRSEQPKKRALD